MTTSVVKPVSSRVETLAVTAVVAGLVTASAFAIDARRIEDDQQRLFDWQISAFYDLDMVDQAVYNALLAASDELWWVHGDLLTFGTEEQRADPWPTVAELDQDYLMPPFVRDMAWTQQGEIEWSRVASFSFEGSAVYFGSGGSLPGQSAYLLQLSHIHKGASWTDGALIWIHEDADAPPPDTIKRDSLIVHGWKEVVPYSGAMEVERLKGR